jgi:DNA processing protein
MSVSLSHDQIGWLCLWRLPGIGPKNFWRLFREYENGWDAYHAQKKDKADVRKNVEEELSFLEKNGGNILAFDDEDYPPSLFEIPDKPPFLSFFGQGVLFKHPMLAIVGARNASYSGKQFAKKLATDLGITGITIVSGLARGIDGAAHEGALETGTIAVMAGGLDKIYPPEHRRLYDQIKTQGLILSEMPAGHTPMPQLFPRRNRIVAALSKGVILVEAALKSGSLITAQYAADFGRDVFAVPGFPTDPRSRGCNQLIQNGAILTQEIQDILSHLVISPIQPLEKKQQPNEQMDADTLLSLISHTPIAIDILQETSELSAAAFQEGLTHLELEGRIIRLGNFISLCL